MQVHHKAYSYKNKKGKTVHVAAHVENTRGGGARRAKPAVARKRGKGKRKGKKGFKLS
jgi:hypothetical protein